jgi:UDP:flavonoid glycosyltransferase YjiC (YdhE family)
VSTDCNGRNDNANAVGYTIGYAIGYAMGCGDGNRGDIQPFTQLGLRLQRDGHRVRLATHSMFRQYVVDKGLEFYPLAGDPMVLSEFMVKTKGFIIPTTPELLLEVLFVCVYVHVMMTVTWLTVYLFIFVYILIKRRRNNTQWWWKSSIPVGEPASNQTPLTRRPGKFPIGRI